MWGKGDQLLVQIANRGSSAGGRKALELGGDVGLVGSLH